MAAAEKRICGSELRQTDQSYLTAKDISAEHPFIRSLGKPSPLLRTAIASLQAYHGRELTILDLPSLLHKGHLAHGLSNRAIPRVFP